MNDIRADILMRLRPSRETLAAPSDNKRLMSASSRHSRFIVDGTGLRRLAAAVMIWTQLCPAILAAGQGGAPGQFLSYGAGARSLGMGKAYTAIADDASAPYWNPAAMTQLEQKEIQMMHVTLFQGTNFDSLSYVHPGSKVGTLGFNYTKMASGGFEKVGVTVDPTSQEIVSLEKLGSFADVQTSMGLSFGRQFTENMSIGVSGKMITHKIDDFSQKFFALDAAFFAKEFFPRHRFAFVAQNMVNQTSGETSDRLPLTIRIGNAYSLLRGRVNVGMDITQSSFSGMGMNFGAEYWVSRWAALRVGLENKSGGIAETTAGLGMKSKRMSLDLAVALHELGMSQRVSIGWRFGGAAKSMQREEAKKLLAMGHELMRQGNYAMAIQRYMAALDSDPSNKQLQSMLGKLQEVAADLPKAPAGDIGRLVASGVKSYMDGDLNASYDSFRAAFDREPANSQLLALTNRLAKLTGKPMVETPKGPTAKTRWTLVDQKLHDALQAIYEGRYDLAIQKCDEVLRIEPNNVTAIGRMGAAFFLLGERDKAVSLWKRALELDPAHKPAIEYLRQLGELK